MKLPPLVETATRMAVAHGIVHGFLSDAEEVGARPVRHFRQLIRGANQAFLDVTAVPEPGSAAIFGGAAAMLMFARRRGR